MAPSLAPAAPRETAVEVRTSPRRAPVVRPVPAATDDEILGLGPEGNSHDAAVGARSANNSGRMPGEDPWRDAADPPQSATDSSEVAADDERTDSQAAPNAPDSESLRAALDANPDLRRAWDDAQAYRETFASPEEARAATAVLADLDRMDALFFSRRPEDHAELARAVAALDPAAFASLAQAMNAQANSQPRTRDGVVGVRRGGPGADAPRDSSDPAPSPTENASPNGAALPSNDAGRSSPGRTTPLQNPSIQTQSTATQAQSDFFHAANAAAVQSVLDSIETQVERLLPENISKSARNRVVGEIYRELDTTLRSNRQLAQQMRDALRSGSLDAEHQRAVVSLVTGRARQALPSVAKRVLSEWTSTVVAAHNDRRARQQAAERRIDIAGSNGTGSDGPRSMTPRDVDYKRMSDSDILNL